METIEIPIFNNIVKDISPRKVGDTVLQDGMNVLFEDGYIKDRYGLFILPYDFNEPVKKVGLFRRMFSEDAYMIIGTTKDLYSFDETSGIFRLITRNYNIGTVTSSGKDITLSGGTWDYADWKEVNLYQISFDSNDINKCKTWYTVASITSSTLLTLEADLTTPVTASHYCLRLCYSGDNNDTWHFIYPWDEDIDENVMLATNSKNFVQVWDATGQCKDFTGYTNFCKHLGYWGSASGGHVIASGIYDIGTSSYNKNAIEVWDADKLSMLDGATYALYDTISEIQGVLPLGSDHLIIYKTDSISMGTITYSGDATNPISIRENYLRNLGVPTIDVVASLEKFHIFFNGRNIYLFDGIQERLVGEGNANYIIKNINKNFVHRSFCILIQEKNLYLLFIPFGKSENPNTCIVFNYKDNTLSYWSFKNTDGEELEFSSKGLYQKTYLPTWADMMDLQTGDITENSLTITSIPDTSFFEIGHGVVGQGIPELSRIVSIDEHSIEIDKEAEETASGVNLKVGSYAIDLKFRWQDLKVVETFQRFMLGAMSGHTYELSEEFYQDEEEPIVTSFVTKDYELNKGLTFFFHEVTIRAGLRDVGEWFDSTVYVRASINYGRTWSNWKELILESGEEPQEFKEKKGYFHMKGKALRLEFRFESPTLFESIFIKYNVGGQSFKYNR